MTSPNRAIDQLPSPPANKSKQLQVLVVGAPRSGSTSIGTALSKLGYKTCIGVAHSYFVENHFPYWTEAINAKHHGLGKAYTSSDYDKFLGKYEALTGWGAALLAEELIAAFPNAKVIVTGRESEKWVESYRETIMFTYLWWRRWVWILPFCGGREQEFVRFKDTALWAWSYGHALDGEEQRRYYEEHNRRVGEVVPKERLLVFKAEEGWEPLCQFLGKKVPEEAFPRTSGRVGFHRDMKGIWRTAVMRAGRNLGLGLGSLALLVVLVTRYRQGKALFSSMVPEWLRQLRII